MTKHQPTQRAGFAARLAFAALVAAGTAAVPLAAGAADAAATFPQKPVTMVVPFPPGAATDIIARTVAQKLGEKWGQSVVVENRAGATGAIGSNYVARSEPDGHTLLVATTSSHTMGPNLSTKLPWDPVKSFAPVTLLAWAPNVLEVNPSVPATSMQELIALLKKNPGKYTFASSGTGSSIHLAGEMFKVQAGVDMVHVPYKGAAPAVADLLGGQVDIMFDTVALSLPHLKAGKLRPLAVTTTRRSSSLPDVPTMREAGLPDYEMAAWIGLLAPADTPPAVVQKIQADVGAVLQMPDVQAKLQGQGTDISGMSSAEFGALIKDELGRYGAIMKQAGIRPGD
ncbi:Bug family tripartite tricarboxylate transporter substrate binding protein [Bordetella genomosp. 13]|uniref:LacI family transcriptional regulator n=1 Tax=Bordetella genomosp. 13 TaxID=463040 RepID=A0A1W6ZGR8_9BORD|nr:tripartite tricarboxylate transporter substrate binding protein [Bordetella genomosp. 13]ARP96566.1 LacI family transcriptional regulator [Bordetella genomosp. 13]